MVSVGRPDRVPVERRVVGQRDRRCLRVARIDRHQIALRVLVDDPVRDAIAVRRPARLRRTSFFREQALRAVAHVDDPELAVRAAAARIEFDALGGADELRAVGRPGGIRAEIADAVPCFAGRAHDVDAAAIDVGAERDPIAVGREGGLAAVAVVRQIDRVAAVDALQKDVAVSGEDEGLAIRRDAGMRLDAGEERELRRVADQRPRFRPSIAGVMRDGHRGREQDRGNAADDQRTPRRALRLDRRDFATRGRAGDRLKMKGEIADGLEALVRALLQAMPHDRVQPRRQFGIGRIVMEDRAHQVCCGGAFERAAAGEHLVEDRAEGEDVGAVIDVLRAHLLGRHVRDGAHHRAGRGGHLLRRRVGIAVRRGELGQTEVEDLDSSVFADEKVLRLEVAMDDALLVRGRESVRDLDGVVEHLA